MRNEWPSVILNKILIGFGAERILCMDLMYTLEHAAPLKVFYGLY